MATKIIYGLSVMTLAMGMTFTSCGDFEPTGYEQLLIFPLLGI